MALWRICDGLAKMSKLTGQGAVAKRVLTAEELKVKKWLAQRLGEIAAREAAVESLKKVRAV
jgi:hypothetical protein